MPAVRVYVSSTYEDLKELRRCVIGAIRKVPNHTPVNMEDYAADGRRPLDKCLADVRASNVYVGVIGSRAGFVPEGYQVSITRLEYEEAWRRRLPCLFFLQPLAQGSASDSGDLERVEQFRELVQRRHTVKSIEHRHELGEDVMKSLFEQALREKHVLRDAILETNPLLPYTCDRVQQSQDLELALQRLRGSPSVPVCLIHGSLEQAPEKFMDWLSESLFGEIVHSKDVSELKLKWPLETENDQDFLSLLAPALARAGQLAPATLPEDLFNALAARPEQYFLSTQLSLDYWRASERSRLLAFTDFVQRSANTPNPPRAALIWMTYKSPGKRTWFSPFRRQRSQALNEDVRAALEELAKQRQTVRPISELADVRQDDVAVWAAKPDVRQAISGRDLTDDITEIFRETSGGGLNMRPLAKRLAALLGQPRQGKDE